MFYARRSEDGRTITASPGAVATCPCCEEAVTPKCGPLVSWHFAHKADVDCDPWAEGEGPWHRAWKERAPLECREVPLAHHRADLLVGDRVIELQSSSLSRDQVVEREHFYTSAVSAMVWIWNFTDASVEILAGHRTIQERPGNGPRIALWKGTRPGVFTYYWQHPKPAVVSAEAPVYLDFGRSVFEVKSMQIPNRFAERTYQDALRAPRRGWGRLHRIDDLARRLLTPKKAAPALW